MNRNQVNDEPAEEHQCEPTTTVINGLQHRYQLEHLPDTDHDGNEDTTSQPFKNVDNGIFRGSISFVVTPLRLNINDVPLTDNNTNNEMATDIKGKVGQLPHQNKSLPNTNHNRDEKLEDINLPANCSEVLTMADLELLLLQSQMMLKHHC